jgi:polar amino acid transport system substrate-binding protein
MAELRRRRRRTRTIGPAIALLMMASGCSGTHGDLVASMKKAGCAKAALADAPPYSTITAGGGAGGYVPVVTQEVLKTLGVPKLCPKTAMYDDMIPDLRARKFDVLPGGLDITPERCKKVAFSEPVTVQHEALIFLRGKSRDVTTYAGIASHAEFKLAVLHRSGEAEFAKKNGVQPAQLVTVRDTQAGIDAVENGRANAFGAAQFTLSKAADLTMEVRVDRSSPVAMIGVAFRKGDAKARDAFDATLERMRGSGALGALYSRYGFPNADDLKGLNRTTVSKSCA